MKVDVIEVCTLEVNTISEYVGKYQLIQECIKDYNKFKSELLSNNYKSKSLINDYYLLQIVSFDEPLRKALIKIVDGRIDYLTKCISDMAQQLNFNKKESADDSTNSTSS